MHIFKIRFKYKSRLNILWTRSLSSSLESNYTGSAKLEWPTTKIRETFIDYFCLKHKHKFIKSSSVLPRKGSGTYFTNAGMNQFKSIILGELHANDIIDNERYVGVANSQKCIRIGGKHSDLDEIGKDTYHHTFFEMLGNWSFGSYTNEKACEYALDLLVNIYKLNINGLYFTYFGGDKNFGLDADLHTKNTWLRLGVPERQILPFGLKENFWEMDIVGPCGPCTEIHYDRLVNSLNNSAEMHKARDLVNMGTERVIELWNIVSMNYNRIDQKTFTLLPHQVIDTGMGLERLSAVLNNLSSNYDTDLFQPLFDHIYSYGKLKSVAHYNDCKLDSQISSQYRTLSDHIRSIVISISDGLIPSRNGLGGFLKFLILKCFKISRDTFKVDDEVKFLNEMVSIVVQTLKSAYPELVGREKYIQEVRFDLYLTYK
jgi:alanyl-tRNA synthetase